MRGQQHEQRTLIYGPIGSPDPSQFVILTMTRATVACEASAVANALNARSDATTRPMAFYDDSKGTPRIVAIVRRGKAGRWESLAVGDGRREQQSVDRQSRRTSVA